MAVLALLLALQDSRIADAVRALDADDPDVRAAAVRTLIELEADEAVRELAKSGDGEKRLRAQEVVAAVTLFRTAPGLRALWKAEPNRVPQTLIGELAAQPRDRWPGILPAEGLQRAVREALAADILADAEASQRFLDKLGCVYVLGEDVLKPAPPVETWWFCLAALGAKRLANRAHAAELLGDAVADLPVEGVDEIATALLACLSDKDAGLYSAYALAATARRLKDDRARIRALVDALAARLAKDDATNALWALWTVSDAAVQAVVIDRMLAAFTDQRARVRSNAVSALYRQSLSPGPLMDRMARGLVPLVADSEPRVRLPAIYTLRDRAPHVTSDALLAAATRSFIARLDDAHDSCREYAAGAIAYVARKSDSARLWLLLTDAHAAVEAALQREKHGGTRANLVEAAAELDKLAALRDARFAKAAPDLLADDIDTRSKAVRALIELDASIDNDEVAPAVRFFRTAPGCRQAWRIRSDAMPPALVAKLSAAPRDKWPEIIGTAVAPELLTADVRIALASDVLADTRATRSAVYSKSTAGWWFSLVALESPVPKGREAAAAVIGRVAHDVPEAAARDIVDALHRRLTDSETSVRKESAGALLWSLIRFKKDEARVRALLAPLIDLLSPDEDSFVRWDAARAMRDTVDDDLKRIIIELLAERLKSKNVEVRRGMFIVLPDLHPAKGAPLDALVSLLIASAEDADVEVRRDAILLLLNGHMSSASDGPFERATRVLLGRFSDTDATCRRYAACKISQLSNHDRLRGDLLRDVDTAVNTALKREANPDVSEWLKDAAAELRRRPDK